LARLVNAKRPRDRDDAAAAHEKPLGGDGGFSLIFSDRYLLLIALLAVAINVVNTSGEYLFGRYVVEAANAAHGSGPEAAAAREAMIGSVYSRFFSTVNLAGFLLQMFVVSRVFRFLGIGRSLFIHPIVALSGYLIMLQAPSITFMAYFKVADNSLDYSLGNTTRQALWLPTSRDAKYKAKQAVDSFFVRTGDVLQAGLVFVGEKLALTVPAFCRHQRRACRRVARHRHVAQSATGRQVRGGVVRLESWIWSRACGSNWPGASKDRSRFGSCSSRSLPRSWRFVPASPMRTIIGRRTCGACCRSPWSAGS
jgi:hypothetical protein